MRSADPLEAGLLPPRICGVGEREAGIRIETVRRVGDRLRPAPEEQSHELAWRAPAETGLKEKPGPVCGRVFLGEP